MEELVTGPPPADLVAAKAHLAVRRLEDVSRTAVGMDPAARSLMGQTLEELAATFEELRAAGEELTRANTELRRVHSELREGRRAFQELFDFAPDGYLISDRFGAIRMANVTATARLGAGRWETLIGKPLTVLVALAH
ncbi:MAG: hypothetical protein QOD86_1169, partial [Miltoncostaeaceae bacterium]|nr:hypothetical protein [Miltoncostaeaceae bacterium]